MTSMLLTARCFGPGLPAAGQVLTLRLEHGLLVLELEGERVETRMDRLRLNLGGFNETHWQLSWDDTPNSWACLIEDPAAQARLAAHPPAELAAAVASLAGRQKSGRRMRRLGLGALGLWLMAPVLLLLALLVAAKPLAGWAITRVSVAQEQKLGEWFWRGQRSRLHLVESGPALEAVQDIGNRLTTGSAYRYRWYLADDPSINAFAMPGGIVVVHTGLMAAAESPEELAGVLAHEVQHVELRHSLHQLAQQAGLRLVVALAIGDPGTAGDIAGRLTQLKFSRDAETEADLAGLESLRRAGIAPQAMVSMFEKLSRDNAGAPPALLSTHPATEARVASLEAAIAEAPYYRAEPLPLDWTAVQASLARDAGTR